MKFSLFFILLCFVHYSAGFTPVSLINETFESGSEGWELSFPADTQEVPPPPPATMTLTAGPNGMMLKVNVTETREENWHIQIGFPVWRAKANSIYRITMDAKSKHPIDVGVSYGANLPPEKQYQYKEGFAFNLKEVWDTYSGEFSSDIEGEDLLTITISLGENIGEYCFDNIMLEEIDQIDQWDAWYGKADERIDEIRKGDISLNFVDSKGNELTGTAEITLEKHAFPFGTSLIINDSIPADEQEWYNSMACSLFNSITIENDFKWVDYEPEPDNLDTAALNKYLKLAEDNDLLVRGHVLAWALQVDAFLDHWSRQGTDEFLVTALKKRIIREVSTYRGKIHEYDVWNEPFHELGHFNLNTPYTKNPDNYWELMDSAFHWARSQDPDADLYLNEYSVISGGQTETLFKLVKGMIDREVPITGIGVQGHFYHNPIEAELIRKRLDRLDELGLKIKVTEFDLGTREEGVLLSEEKMASEYVRFLKTAFSHPAVEGITLWGFWDRVIWNAPTAKSIGSGLFNVDMTPKMAGDSVVNLLLKEWTTKESVDLSEVSSIRGFYGDYSVTLVSGGKKYTGTFSISKESAPEKIVLAEDGVSNAVVSEKKAQRFLAVTDSKNRVVTVTGVSPAHSVSIDIINLRGQIVYQSSADAVSSMRFNMESLPTGIYVSRIRNGSKLIQQKLLLTR